MVGGWCTHACPWEPSQVRVPPQPLVASGSVMPPPGEDRKMDPKQQGETPGTHVKLWRLGRALCRVPGHVCIVSGHRDIAAQRMGIHPLPMGAHGPAKSKGTVKGPSMCLGG